MTYHRIHSDDHMRIICLVFPEEDPVPTDSPHDDSLKDAIIRKQARMIRQLDICVDWALDKMERAGLAVDHDDEFPTFSEN